MNPENLSSRIENLRSNADRKRRSSVICVGVAAVNAFAFGLNLIEPIDNKPLVVVNLAFAAGGAILGFSEGLKSIQVGQEVASLSAIETTSYQQLN